MSPPATSALATHAERSQRDAQDAPARARSGPRPGAARLALAVLAGALLAAWLIVDPRTPDLAAQVYRVDLYRRIGFSVWDEHWYAGHHLPGYSLLFPPLGALLGVRLLGALCVLSSTLLFERILARAYGERGTRLAVAWFAVAAVGDVWLGRLAFALGVTLALAAVLALLHRRAALAAVAAAACAAASPVAALFLALAALSAALHARTARALLTLALPAAVVVLALSLLFPEGGWEPFPLRSFAAAALVAVAFLAALPRQARLLRTGGALYLLACALLVAVHSPVGSNIERYGVLLAGPLLLCAWLATSPPTASAARASERRSLGPPALAALALTAVWVLWGPVRETRAVAGSEATRAAYYLPIERFLASLREGPVRVEVPLTRSHWEAALLAPHVSLARGWEKQLDERYDGVLLRSGLTAASYAAWLRAQAVAYVALPDATLDPSSAQEGRVIRSGPSYLEPVFASRHWRVYHVLGAQRLVQGAATLTALGSDGFVLRARRPGSFLVRVRYTRYWTLTHGTGCVREAPGGWTQVQLRTPGAASVAARFSLARALGDGAACVRSRAA